MVIRYCIILILFLILLISPVQAGITDAASEAINNGLSDFIRGIVDDFVGISVASANASQPTGQLGMDLLYSVATFTPNPFTFSPVNDIKDLAMDIYFELAIILLSLVIISYLVNRNNPHKLKNILIFCCGIIGVLIFETLFLWFFLVLNDTLSKAVLLPSLNSITFSPENLSLYVIMGIAYGLLMLCFAWRTLVILFWGAAGIIIGLLWLPGQTREWSEKAHLYLIQMIFYQFAIVVWYTACIWIIQATPVQMQIPLYLVMVLCSAYASYKFIFGIDIIKTTISTGSKVILLVK